VNYHTILGPGFYPSLPHTIRCEVDNGGLFVYTHLTGGISVVTLQRLCFVNIHVVGNVRATKATAKFKKWTKSGLFCPIFPLPLLH